MPSCDPRNDRVAYRRDANNGRNCSRKYRLSRGEGCGYGCTAPAGPVRFTFDRSRAWFGSACCLRARRQCQTNRDTTEVAIAGTPAGGGEVVTTSGSPESAAAETTVATLETAVETAGSAIAEQASPVTETLASPPIEATTSVEGAASPEAPLAASGTGTVEAGVSPAAGAPETSTPEVVIEAATIEASPAAPETETASPIVETIASPLAERRGCRRRGVANRKRLAGSDRRDAGHRSRIPAAIEATPELVAEASAVIVAARRLWSKRLRPRKLPQHRSPRR